MNALRLFLFSLGSVLVSCSRYPHRHYNYIETKMTWSKAQNYCRQHHSDLATFESMEEVQQLQPTFSFSWAWIGLIDNTSSWRGIMGKEGNSWRWSATGQTSQSGFQMWSSAEPDYGNRYETCVMMDTTGLWFDKDCSNSYGFVCFTERDLGVVSYQYISSPSSWVEAQTFCRKQHTDLAVIENSIQNTQVNNSVTPGAIVWIGLYRVPWTWSDHSPSSFRNWRSISPNYPHVQHCVTENIDHIWDDERCEEGWPSICQTVSKLQTFVRGRMISGADLTLPQTQAQILRKLDEELRQLRWTAFTLTWTMRPVKDNT